MHLEFRNALLSKHFLVIPELDKISLAVVVCDSANCPANGSRGRRVAAAGGGIVLFSHIAPISRVVAPLLAAAVFSLGAPDSAEASYRTLGRALGNIIQSPLDLVLSPIVAALGLNRNIRDIDDTRGVRIAYFVPGYFWMTGVQIGASVMRGITGGLELIPGLILLPFPESDLDPLFDPVENSAGLVEWENGVMDVKFGINYQGAAY